MPLRERHLVHQVTSGNLVLSDIQQSFNRGQPGQQEGHRRGGGESGLLPLTQPVTRLPRKLTLTGTLTGGQGQGVRV